MKEVNTCATHHRLNPLIAAVEAVALAGKGELMSVHFDSRQPFEDMKDWLADKGVGFREIYADGRMTLEFTKEWHSNS